MIDVNSHDFPKPRPQPLCPNCGHSSIRITTSVLIHYDIIFDASNHDFAVIDELVGDAMWDETNDAWCPVCGWQGTVGDLRRAHKSLKSPGNTPQK